MSTFMDISLANSEIRTTNIKGKEYAEVNQRIKAFRMVYPEGCIRTEMLRCEDGMCIFRAEVYEMYLEDLEGNTKYFQLLGTGTAYEYESSSYINKTSYIENCETSAVGRALGMCGFGIDTSVASYEEVANAIKQQEQMQEKMISMEEADELLALMASVKSKDGKSLNVKQYLKGNFKKASVDDLTFEEYRRAKEQLEKAKADLEEGK